MEQIHILFLIDLLYSRHGGAEGILWRITRLLPQDRFRCSIATFASDPQRVVADAFECPVYLLPIHRSYDWKALKAAIRLGRLIRTERVSIVHTFFPTSDLFGGIVAKLSGCPILISSRRDMGFARTSLHRIGYRVARGMFDQVQNVAEAVRLWHVCHDRLPPEKTVTLHNGVDLEEIDRARMHPERRLTDGASPVVACVANVRPVKGIEVLVEAAALVCRELPQARFVVIGQCQDQAYLDGVIALADRLRVSRNIVFAGASANVPAALDGCNVFFLPSHSEGLSNAMLEAMACGLPCVGTNVGGNRELIEHGTNGYLIPAGDAKAAAVRILELLRNCDQAGQMGREGRRIVEQKFSSGMMIARLVEMYERLLERRRERVSAWRMGGCRVSNLEPKPAPKGLE